MDHPLELQGPVLDADHHVDNGAGRRCSGHGVHGEHPGGHQQGPHQVHRVHRPARPHEDRVVDASPGLDPLLEALHFALRPGRDRNSSTSSASSASSTSSTSSTGPRRGGTLHDRPTRSLHNVLGFKLRLLRDALGLRPPRLRGDRGRRLLVVLVQLRCRHVPNRPGRLVLALGGWATSLGISSSSRSSSSSSSISASHRSARLRWRQRRGIGSNNDVVLGGGGRRRLRRCAGELLVEQLGKAILSIRRKRAAIASTASSL